MKKTIKIIIAAFAVLIVLVSLFVLFMIWYGAYDVTGLNLYENESIRELIPNRSGHFITTEDGCVYITGNDAHSDNRKYRNTISHRNDILGMAGPVKIYDGKIAEIIPYAHMGTLLIDENGELFDFDDFETTKLADGVFYAIRSHYSHGQMIFGEDGEKIYYVIDTSNILYAMNGEGEKKELFSEVVFVDYYLDTLLVLFENGDLNQYTLSDGGAVVLKEKIFENVCSFDITDTSLRFNGEKIIDDDEEARSNPLINVLTFDGALYVKGAYNLLCCTRSAAAHPEPKIIDKWTLIAENVECFSMSYMGTVFKYKNSTAGYYGFDTDNSYGSENKFGYLDLDVTNITNIYAGDVEVIVQANKTIYVWGYSIDHTFDIARGNHYNLFDGEPHTITVP